MSGVTLMFSAMVLIVNSYNALDKVHDKSVSLFNLFTGLLYIFMHLVVMIKGVWLGEPGMYYLGSLGSLLFGFTYFIYGINQIFDFDQRNLGWYSMFVAINAVFFAALNFQHIGGSPFDGINWLIWGFLWATNYFAHNRGHQFGKWLSYFTIVAAIFTCWIPGLLIIFDKWPK